MMREITHVRQEDQNLKKRWFLDNYFDLSVWLNEQKEIEEFHLCYDLNGNEHALLWDKEKGYRHRRVDDGEDRPGKFKAAPIFLLDGNFAKTDVALLFEQSSKDIDESVSSFVLEKIMNFSQ